MKTWVRGVAWAACAAVGAWALAPHACHASLVRAAWRPEVRSEFGTSGKPSSALAVVGLDGEMEHNSEYLFGFSGKVPAKLVVNLANGATVELSTATNPLNASKDFNQGWWSGVLDNVAENPNYFVGDLSADGTMWHNNFFSFALGELGGQSVLSATLQLTRAEGFSELGRITQRYTLMDATTDPTVLNATVGTSWDIFEELGSGQSYGSFDVTVSGDASELLSFSLNTIGLADLNAAVDAGDDYFSIGGTLNPSIIPEPLAAGVWSLLLCCAVGGWPRR